MKFKLSVKRLARRMLRRAEPKSTGWTVVFMRRAPDTEGGMTDGEVAHCLIINTRRKRLVIVPGSPPHLVKDCPDVFRPRLSALVPLADLMRTLIWPAEAFLCA